MSIIIDTTAPSLTGGGADRNQKGDIKMDLSNLWEKIKLLFSEMWPIIWPLLKKILTDNFQVALKAAMKIVPDVQAEMPNATGQEKIAAVMSRLMVVLAAQGIVMGEEMLRTIIKIAYEHMVAEPEVVEEAKAVLDYLVIAAPPHPVVEP
jgi:hypothetical protein